MRKLILGSIAQSSNVMLAGPACASWTCQAVVKMRSHGTEHCQIVMVAAFHNVGIKPCEHCCGGTRSSNLTYYLDGPQVDPHLSRSVVVSTKLDTRLPQFARGSDVELFLRPPGRLLEPGMLGGCPFFT